MEVSAAPVLTSLAWEKAWENTSIPDPRLLTMWLVSVCMRHVVLCFMLICYVVFCVVLCYFWIDSCRKGIPSYAEISSECKIARVGGIT